MKLQSSSMKTAVKWVSAPWRRVTQRRMQIQHLKLLQQIPKNVRNNLFIDVLHFSKVLIIFGVEEMHFLGQFTFWIPHFFFFKTNPSWPGLTYFNVLSFSLLFVTWPCSGWAGEECSWNRCKGEIFWSSVVIDIQQHFLSFPLLPDVKFKFNTNTWPLRWRLKFCAFLV